MATKTAEDTTNSLPGGRKGGMTAEDINNLPDSAIANKSPAETKNLMHQAAAGKPGANDSSLKIRIELDLEVEVHLTARVKGDITIGLL